MVFLLSNFPHSTDSYIEVLDGSRVHPETYEWARKMAVDALEYDESAEDANPAGALEEILENPERLKDLDLDAFAEELERQVSLCGAALTEEMSHVFCCQSNIFEQLEKKDTTVWNTYYI